MRHKIAPYFFAGLAALAFGTVALRAQMSPPQTNPKPPAQLQMACNHLTAWKDKLGNTFALPVDNPPLTMDQNGVLHIHCGSESFRPKDWSKD